MHRHPAVLDRMGKVDHCGVELAFKNYNALTDLRGGKLAAMVLLLSDLLLPALQAAAYAALGLSIRIHAALRSLIALSAIATARLAAAAPALRPLLSALFALPPGEHLGSRPRPPTVLGVAVAEQLQEDQWPAAMEALGRLLGWCVPCSPPLLGLCYPLNVVGSVAVPVFGPGTSWQASPARDAPAARCSYLVLCSGALPHPCYQQSPKARLLFWCAGPTTAGSGWSSSTSQGGC